MKNYFKREEMLAGAILENFFETAPDEIREKIRGKFFLAGGTLSSILTNEEVNDYDIYFTEYEALDAYMKAIAKKYDDITWKPRYVYRNSNNKNGEVTITTTVMDVSDDLYLQGVSNDPNYSSCDDSIFISENAVTFENKFQVIFRFIGEPEVITEQFDFDHCCAYIKHECNKGLVVPNHTIKSLMTKELKVRGTKYPIDTIHRSRKYIERGYTLDIVEMLKLVMAINDLSLRDTMVFRDQMIGIDALYLRAFIETIDSGDVEIGNSESIFDILREAYDAHLLKRVR